MNFHSLRFFLVLIFLVQLFSCDDENIPENQIVVTSSPYLSKVFEYVYGPGQHAYMVRAADTVNFVGEPTDDKGFLFLGGFGGYVIAGFDHNVLNKDGADFEVYALQGVSPEPAIVYVMSDENGDGLPNEIWYELKGNLFDVSKRNYWVRYYKAVSDSANIKWLDSENNTGELAPSNAGAFSSKWWWSETKTDSITLFGTRLPNAYDDNSIAGAPLWTVPGGRFQWGYAENLKGIDYDEVSGGNQLDISNAVDIDGHEVYLENIRFIKVQTAVFQMAGWLNEVSSEVRGARDLNK